ncbi:MAG: HNH endonuclease [Chloroflexi bacterium]|nr:HNH endonuclease [Chloroflexota bacterium]
MNIHARPSGVIELPLGRGLVTLVDAAEVPALVVWTWNALRRPGGRGWYAVRWEETDGRRRSVYLHRFLLSAPPDSEVDHINRDTLDNRRANLRLCTASLNAVNKAVRSPSTGFRGVYRSGIAYRAQVTIGGQRRSLGQFPSPEAAARAYDEAARVVFGSFARLNFAEELP